jgi:uncharacterized protein YabE (DUF348 family)
VTVRATRVRRLRIRRAIGRTLLTATAASAGLLYLSIRQQGITLVLDGRPVAVPSMQGSVGQLLQEHGIAVDASDEIVPEPSTALADGMTVTVDTDATVTAADPEAGVWVVEGAVAPATIGVAAELAGSSPFGNASVGRSPIRAVSVVVKGKGHDVLTNATTVGGLLSAMGITPDGDDRILPPPRTPLRSGRTIRFVRVRTVTRTVERRIPFRTSTTVSHDLDPGESRIVRRGRAGTAVATYEVRIADGRVVARTLERRRVADAPVTRLRHVGPSPTSGVGGESGVAGTVPSGVQGSQTGVATWYDPPWSGLTAAHPSLPFGTMVTVTNLANGSSVTVRINDRGPFGAGRIIDLSPEAFQIVAPLSQGIANVRIVW